LILNWSLELFKWQNWSYLKNSKRKTSKSCWKWKALKTPFTYSTKTKSEN